MAVSIPDADESGFQPLFAALAARLEQAPAVALTHDDFSFDRVAAPLPPGIPAAVLIPVVTRPQPTLLFTRRTESLARHSGQVSFPGGRAEGSDASPAATALRETWEETGIAPDLVRVAGYMPRYLTGTGFDIQPVVGVLAPGFTLTPDLAEVAATFEVPLAFFRDPASRRHETRAWQGGTRSFYSFSHAGHEIWGATAAIIVDLVTRLGAIEIP